VLVAFLQGFGDQGFAEQLLGPADPFVFSHDSGTSNALWQIVGRILLPRGWLVKVLWITDGIQDC
ncbi:MAG: hypothetical protein MUP11_08600, partial [Anaerolineales bacterium]|nr:hypothetical protein [Anaerolineales bacterium]